MFALRSSLLNLSKSIQKSLSMKNKKVMGLFLANRKGRVVFYFLFFLNKEKQLPLTRQSSAPNPE